MSDTIDSTFGNLRLEAHLDAREHPRAPSQLSQNSARLSQVSERNSAISRPRTSLDRFFEDPSSSPKSGILFDRESDGRDAAREETRKMESMENEIFNLKLKITLLEKSAKLGADSKELYHQLTVTHASQRAVEAENAALKKQIQQLQQDNGTKAKLAEQEEMLTTFLEAQDEYSSICDEIISAFQEPGLEEYLETKGQVDGSQLDGKLAVIRNIVANLLSDLESAKENYADVEVVLKEYLEDKAEIDRELDEARAVLKSLGSVFISDVPPPLLLENVRGLVSNNAALESQLQRHIVQQQRLEDQIEDLAAKVPLDAHADNERLRQENAKLTDAVSRASARSYDITRQFFRRLTAYMGPEWGEENDKRLRGIMEQSRRYSKSKLPLLVELMMQCVDEMAMMARGAEVLPAENAELEEKVRYLEDLLTQELTRMGADKVLLSKYKDVEQRLKIETEKRKNEYIGYQRSLTNLSLQ